MLWLQEHCRAIPPATLWRYSHGVLICIRGQAWSAFNVTKLLLSQDISHYVSVQHVDNSALAWLCSPETCSDPQFFRTKAPCEVQCPVVPPPLTQGHGYRTCEASCHVLLSTRAASLPSPPPPRPLLLFASLPRRNPSHAMCRTGLPVGSSHSVLLSPTQVLFKTEKQPTPKNLC